MPRFAGRAVNFAGWVLRNLGAAGEAADRHAAALEIAQRQGTAEVTIAALEDLAEQCLDQGDPDGARARLAEAAGLLQGDLVFGWRLDLKHRLVTARLDLLCGDPGHAAGVAAELESRAAALGVPRYLSVARLLRHRADRALGRPVDLDAVQADLDLVDGSVAVEAWWWTGEVAAEFANPGWLDRAADRAGGWPSTRTGTPTCSGGTRTSAWLAGARWQAEPSRPGAGGWPGPPRRPRLSGP